MWKVARPTNNQRLWLVLIVGSLLVTQVPSARGEDAGDLLPDGVCYPVSGSGFILPASPEADTVRVGALSPLVEGDVLVVESGTITFLDFRDGQSSVFGVNSRYKVPAVIDRNRPTAWEDLKERLRRLFLDAQRQKLEAGASRSDTSGVWPDGELEFAPEVPIVFEWWGVTDTLTAIRIRSGGTQTVIALPDTGMPAGSLTWRTGERSPGPIEWCLLDTHGEPYLTGRFRLLTAQEAEAKRTQYFNEARNDPMPPELAAVLRALVDRTYLW